MVRVIAWAACLSATVAHAEPPADALSFPRALGLAGELPSIVAERAAAHAERGNPVGRGWQPLALRIAPVLRGAPAADRGVEGTVALEQAFPLADLGGTRRATQDAVAEHHAARATAQVLEARLEVAASWIAGWAARERLVATARDRELARALAAIGERARAAGTLTEPERADARAFLAEVELRYLDAEGALADATFATARSLGRRRAVRSEGELPWPALPAEPSWGAVIARVRTSPAAIARRIAARVALARAAEERAARSPQVVVGAWLGKDAPAGWITGVSLGASLPHDRGTRELGTARVAARLAEAEAGELVARAALELTAALHEVEHTQAVLAEVTTTLVPAAEAAAERRQRAFEVGEATIVEVIAAQRTANSARARRTEARAAHAWARVRAWLLVEATTEVSR